MTDWSNPETLSKIAKQLHCYAIDLASSDTTSKSGNVYDGLTKRAMVESFNNLADFLEGHKNSIITRDPRNYSYNEGHKK